MSSFLFGLAFVHLSNFFLGLPPESFGPLIPCSVLFFSFLAYGSRKVCPYGRSRSSEARLSLSPQVFSNGLKGKPSSSGWFFFFASSAAHAISTFPPFFLYAEPDEPLLQREECCARLQRFLSPTTLRFASSPFSSVPSDRFPSLGRHRSFRSRPPLSSL